MKKVRVKMISKKFLVAVAMVIVSIGNAVAQSCNCPTVCSPCLDNITQLSIQYNGNDEAMIVAKVTTQTLHSATLRPGDIFVVTGTGIGNRFLGSRLLIYVDGVKEQEIDLTCNTPVTVNETFGNFTIAGAKTSLGAPICCAPNKPDKIAPMFGAAPADMTINTEASTCSALVEWSEPQVIDCNLRDVTQSHISGSSFPMGQTIVEYIASDEAGNSTVHTFTVNVVDNSNPVFVNAPPSIVTVTDPEKCTAIVTWTAPNVTDCTFDKVTVTPVSGSEFPIGTTVVTYTAYDKSGNVAEHKFSVTVNDNQKPKFIGGPSMLSFFTDQGKCTATVSWIEPTVTDCLLNKVTRNYQPGASFPIGNTIVKYTATDKSGNVAEYTFTVQVTDKQPPTFAGTPGDIKAALDPGKCTATVTWTAPVASDCNLDKVTANHSPGSSFPIGETMVTYTATDKANNAAKVSFKVFVSDDGAPVFSQTPTDVEVQTEDGKCAAVVTWELPVVQDCNLDMVTSGQAPGDEFMTGTNIVKYVAVDKSNNTTEYSFDITVADHVPPVISNCPSNIDVITNDPKGSIVSWVEPKATDNCELKSIASTHVSGELFPIGITTVKYIATDAGGKSAECSFQITVSLDETVDPDLPPIHPTFPELQDIVINKVITPDGDGKNDLWIIENIQDFQNKIVVFDRWGSVIFSATDYDNEKVVWDGSSNGSTLVPTGTYFYVVSYTKEGRSIESKGFVELIQ